jgi:hypothetical protein
MGSIRSSEPNFRPKPLVAGLRCTPVLSAERPFITLTIASVPGRGFVFKLTDSSGHAYSSPIVSPEGVARALEGRNVTIRNGGVQVDFLPASDMLGIKCGTKTDASLTSLFRTEEIEAALRVAAERTTI